MRSWSSINVLCTEPGVATRTDPTTPPPSLSLSLTLIAVGYEQMSLSNPLPRLIINKRGFHPSHPSPAPLHSINIQYGVGDLHAVLI